MFIISFWQVIHYAVFKVNFSCYDFDGKLCISMCVSLLQILYLYSLAVLTYFMCFMFIEFVVIEVTLF